MAYIGGGAQPITDWEAHDEIWKLRRDVEQLQAQVAELTAALQRLDQVRDMLARDAQTRLTRLVKAQAILDAPARPAGHNETGQ
jgi:cell division protein FtsB